LPTVLLAAHRHSVAVTIPLGRQLLLSVVALLDRSLLLLSPVARCLARLRLLAVVCCVALLHVRQVYRLADPVMRSPPTRHPLQARPRACHRPVAPRTLVGPASGVAASPLVPNGTPPDTATSTALSGYALVAVLSRRSARTRVRPVSQGGFPASVVVLARVGLVLLRVLLCPAMSPAVPVHHQHHLVGLGMLERPEPTDQHLREPPLRLRSLVRHHESSFVTPASSSSSSQIVRRAISCRCPSGP